MVVLKGMWVKRKLLLYNDKQIEADMSPALIFTKREVDLAKERAKRMKI